MSKIHINEYHQCPHCHIRITHVTGELPKDPDACVVCICNSCGHCLAVGMSPKGNIESGSFDYEWLHLYFDEYYRKAIREAQEDAHHKLGQWG